MINIVADVDAILERLDRVTERCREFPGLMGSEFVAWQSEDMNRRAPDLSAPDDQSVEALIPARGPRVQRYRARPSGRARGRRISGVIEMRTGIGRPPVMARRPIVRAILMDQLRDRMRQLLLEKLTWQ